MLGVVAHQSAHLDRLALATKLRFNPFARIFGFAIAVDDDERLPGPWRIKLVLKRRHCLGQHDAKVAGAHLGSAAGHLLLDAQIPHNRGGKLGGLPRLRFQKVVHGLVHMVLQATRLPARAGKQQHMRA